jgi:ATP-dependent exoDNAse (exonuclease V) beta subunit
LKQLDTLFVEDVSDPEKTIVFSTVHRAKGLEWDTVRVIRPDLLPHPLAMPNEDGSWSDEQQQEENCCYIAATRARHDLGYVRDWPFDQSGKRLDLVSVTQSSVPLGIKPEMDPFASMPEEGMTWTPPPVRSSTPTRRATDVMGPAPRRPELQEEVLRAEYEAECEEHLRDFDLDFDDPEHDEDLDGGSNGYNPGFVESPALAKRITPPPAPVPPPRVIPPTPKSFVDDGEPF